MAVVYDNSLKNSRKAFFHKLNKRHCFIITLCVLLCNYVINNVINTKPINNTGTEFQAEPNDKQEIIDYKVPTKTKEQINRRFCGTPVCKFIFPFFIKEQESRARLHVRNIITMAQETNRVVVLPHVGSSRLEACKLFTFDFYYSIESIQRSSPNVKFITQDQFLLWNQEMKAARVEMATAHIVKLQSKEKIQMPEFESNLVNFEKYRERFCLQPFDYLKYDDRQGKKVLEHSIMIPNDRFKSLKHQDKISRTIIRALQPVKSEVMLMCYRPWILDMPYQKHPPAPLVYADHLVERAKTAAKLLYPYIAIHWRMETAMPEELFGCSQHLIEYIQDTKAQTGIDNVYISTDYPIDGGRQHSGTFYKLTKEHHRAADLLKNNLNLYTWARINSSLPFLNETKFLSYRSNEGDDKLGTLAIIEKLILVYANWFVSGPRKCCRFSSSYTAQVVNERARIIKSQTHIDNNSKLWNVKDWWEY